MEIPIMAGARVDGNPAARVDYPVQLEPVPGQDGMVDAYLRPTEGIDLFATGPGVDRGGIVWDGVHYRVSGTRLISISAAGVIADLGEIPGTGPVRFDFSFDRLGIAADGDLYYYDGATLTVVSDIDIGTVEDMTWLDSYWVFTDGVNIGVTEIADQDAVSPLKFGTTDRPDPVQCVLKVQNELNVLSRNAIDVFRNVGGTGFPFARETSGHIPKGPIGKRAACAFGDAIAFLGGGRNEAPSVYLGRNAQTVKISSLEIDTLLLEYTEAQLATAFLEEVVNRGGQFLYVRLPDRTAVYAAAASAAAQRPVWFFLTSTLNRWSPYRACSFVRAHDAWIVADPDSNVIGRLTDEHSQHYGVDVRWEFSTPMLRNEGNGAQIHQLELVALTGAVPEGKDPMVSTSYSVDGRTFSQDRAIRSGKRGDRTRRLIWLKQGAWSNWRIQRFRGDSSSRLSAMKLDARIEAFEH